MFFKEDIRNMFLHYRLDHKNSENKTATNFTVVTNFGLAVLTHLFSWGRGGAGDVEQFSSFKLLLRDLDPLLDRFDLFRL